MLGTTNSFIASIEVTDVIKFNYDCFIVSQQKYFSFQGEILLLKRGKIYQNLMVTNFLFQPHDRGHHCIIRIHMRDSSVNFIRHAFEISLIRSEVNFLADAPNMQVLHITNGSSVGRLHDIFLHTNHSNIEDPCFKVEGSKITELQHIHASCPTILENSTIGAISNQLVLNSSKITNLQIDKIFAKGLVFRPGGLNVMKNVTISHCEINCLSVWNTVLSIANVNILKCDEPCIVFGMNSQLHTYNLFIENKLISRTSDRKYIIPSSVDNFDMYTNRKKITIDFANCNLEEELGSIFVCDLSPYRHQVLYICFTCFICLLGN